MLIGFSVQAEESFVDILNTLNAQGLSVASEVPYKQDLLIAKDLQIAESILAKANYSDLRSQQIAPKLMLSDIEKLIQKKKVTFVIVPGVLGEFIDNRAFEELFTSSAGAQEQWQQKVKAEKTTDSRFNLQTQTLEREPLSELVNVGEISDAEGNSLVNLVILKTKLGSLESVGNDVEKAKLFNRRLQKFFNMTKAENIVLIGYSRGTPLALEMITQAEKEGLSYLKNVKAVVSYAGVIFGSALADVTNDLTNESGKLFNAAKNLANELQVANSILERPYRFAQNTVAISRFLTTFAQNTQIDVKANFENTRSGDFKTIAALIAKVVSELGIKTLHDFNGHVLRTKHFINEILNSVQGLRTESLEKWWKTHSLPKQVEYFSIGAVMADPEKSLLEKEVFYFGHGYSDSLDDKSLLENKRTYEKISGVSLNDSQVALHQTLFLPQTIASLNPDNKDLKIKLLGVLETHHWGVSLQVVNKMKDGRTNPFPRKMVLLALAAYLNQQRVE